MLLNLTMHSLRHLFLFIVVLLHEALFELGGAEDQSNFGAGLFIALLMLLVFDWLLVQAMRARLVEIFCCVVELELLQSITFLFFICQVVGGHLFALLVGIFHSWNDDLRGFALLSFLFRLLFLLIDLIKFESKFNWADNGPISSLDLPRGRWRRAKYRVQLLFYRFLLDRQAGLHLGHLLLLQLAALGGHLRDPLFAEGADACRVLFFLGWGQDRDRRFLRSGRNNGFFLRR